MLSSAAASTQSSSFDLTRYRRKLTEVSALSKDEIDSLRMYDAEQLRFEETVKDRSVDNDPRKKRAASCTCYFDQEKINGSRRYSVPRISNCERKIKAGRSTSALQKSLNVCEEPSVSGLSSSTDDETAANKCDSALSTPGFPSTTHQISFRNEDKVININSDDSILSLSKLGQHGSSCEKEPGSLPSHRTLGLKLNSVGLLPGRRLSIPKRNYSPEPVKRTRFSLGFRRATETIRLSDLKEKVAVLKYEEFTLPVDFNSYRKNHLSSSTAANKPAEDKSLKVFEDRQKALDGALLGASDVVGIIVSGEEEIVSNTSCFSVPEQNNAAGILDESLVKRKRGRPRKYFNTPVLAHETDYLNSPLETGIMQDVNTGITEHKTPIFCSSAISPMARGAKDIVVGGTFIKKSPSLSGTPITSDEANLKLLLEAGAGEAEKDSVAAEYIAGGLKNTITIARKKGAENENRICDSNLFAASQSGTDRSGAMKVSETKDVDAVVRVILEELICKLCELDNKTENTFCGLVMEPLRRPQERRRVPPLRIRLPKRREVRIRVPARSRDYSPPGRTFRPKFSRVSTTPQSDTPTTVHLASKRSRRSSRLAKVSTVLEGDINISALLPEDNDTSSLAKEQKHSSSVSPVVPSGHSESTLGSTVPSFDEVVKSCLKDCVFVDEVSNYAKLLSMESENFSPSVVYAEEGPISLHDHAVNVSKELSISFLHMNQSSSTTSVVGPPLSTSEGISGRPTRQKKSYHELYPSIFKHRRKKSGESLSVRKAERLSMTQIKKRRKASPLSDCHEVSSENVSRKFLPSVTNSNGKQRRTSKFSRQPPDVDEIYVKKEEAVDVVEDIGEPFRTDPIIVEKGKDKKRRAPEGLLLCPKGSIFFNGEVYAENNNRISELENASVLSPHRALEQLELAKKSNDNLEQDLSANISATRASKRSKKASITDTRKVITGHVLEGNAVTAENNSMMSTRKKSKRGAYSINANEGTSVKKLSMPYFKRIAQRRKINPLAIGLKSRSEDTDDKIIYRELLLRGKELRRIEAEEELDVDNFVVPVGDDEFGFTNPAGDVASAIDRVLSRPSFLGENGETVDFTADIIIENASGEDHGKVEVLKEMLSVVLAQYTADVMASAIYGGPSVEYSTVLMNARHLRDRVFTFSEERRVSAQWAHKCLVKQLPIPMLATYINLLRYCKSVARYLVDILLKEQKDDENLNMANRLIMNFMNNKVLDPQTASITKTLGKRHLDSICLLAVDPYFAHLDYTPKIKAHEYIFKVLFPNSFGRVEQLRPCLPSSVEFSVAEVVEYLIDVVAKRLKQLIRKHPSKKVVLAGWGTSCYINHEVVQSVPNVHAILDFAFPLKTVDGMRGDADDTLLLTYCPTLFVVGEQAMDCDTVEIQKLASRMKALSGVIIVGSANSNLQVSPSRLSVERFTQKTVHRALIDDVIDFLEKNCLKSPSDSKLKPFPVMETSKADLSVMRGSTTSSRYIPKSRRQSDTGVFLDTGRKRLVCRDSHETECPFKRPHTGDVVQNEQPLLISGASLSSLDSVDRNSFYKPKMSSASAPAAVKCLADETLDNLMSPL